MSKPDLFQLLDQAHAHAADYAANVRHRPVFPTDADLAALEIFDEDMPATGCDPSEMLTLLHTKGSPATTAQTGGRYFGFVNGGLHPPALAARWLADTWDQNSALYVMSPIASRLEAICERWLTSLFRLPAGTAVGLVSGTSASLVCGIAAARNEIMRRHNWSVVDDGLIGAPEMKVVVGEQAHGAVLKGLSLLGLGKERVHKVPSDDQGRMIAAELPQLDARTLLILQAGNVNTGAFDPFSEICPKARAAGAWTHVDGAFGLWAAGSATTYPLYAGAEMADSWSVDAHKTLNVPYDCGIILCRDRAALASALQASGSYLQFSDDRDGMFYTADMSRRARAVELWATLKTMGMVGVESLIDQLCGRAVLFADLLRQAGFRILNDVVFNQVLVACDTPDATRVLLETVQRSGECWCGSTIWNDESVIRISVCSWETTEEDIRRSAAAFAAAKSGRETGPIQAGEAEGARE